MGLTLNEMWLKKRGIVDAGGTVECQRISRTEDPASIYPEHVALIELSLG
jgi:hypothetical protein